MHGRISFSPPESGGMYFTCIAYVEGVVFQLKLRDVQFCATFFYVLCRVDSEGTLRFSWQHERQEKVNFHYLYFLESVNRNLEVGDLARARISVYIGIVMF